MTQDEIIEMARQAGAAVGKPTPDGPNIVFTQCLDIYAFAKLVAVAAASKEREALRESFRVVTAAEASAAILHEREACAKECEHTALRMGSEWMAQHCANAIRARGEVWTS